MSISIIKDLIMTTIKQTIDLINTPILVLTIIHKLDFQPSFKQMTTRKIY